MTDVIEKMNWSLNQHCSDFIEIVGDAGTGKSTLLKQIEPTLQINGIFPNLISIKGSSTLQLSEVLLDELKLLGLDISIFEQYKGHIKTILYKSFVSLKTPESDVFILMIDDAHLLSKETLDLLRQIFNNIPGSRLFLILCGRPGFETDSALHIHDFDDEEFLDYFIGIFGQEWVSERYEILKWFSATTDQHPYRLSLLTEMCVQKGLLSHTYTAPIDLFFKLDFPDELIEVIKQKFVLSELSKDKRNLVNILAHSFSGWTQNDLRMISGKSCLKIIRQLVQKQWIIKDNRNAYRIVHPVLLEWIKSQCKDESVEIYRRILNSGVRLSKSEECAYLLTKKSQTDSERKTLLEFSSELANDGLYFSANQILEKLNPDFDQLEIGVKAAKNFAYLNQNDKARNILKKLLSQQPIDNTWKIYHYLGYLTLVDGNVEEAASIMLKGLSQPNLSITGLVWLHYRIALVYANQWNLDAVHKSLAVLKEHASKDPEFDLLYHSIVANLNTNIPMDIDTEPFIQEGIKLAKKQHDHQQAAYFEIALCYEYVNLRDMEKLKSAGKRLLKYGIELFDTNIQHQAHYLLSHGYFNFEDYDLAIEHMLQTISILEKTKIAYNRDSSLSTLVLLYNNIGCGIKEKKTLNKLEEWVKDHPILIMEERLKYTRHELRLGQQKDGLEDLQKLMED
ncbi:MAG: ATP-binding protein, partial [Candidatus Marinimicrobia bacterium]|nr:ATP-binding protein [Candidatus Neomarinimicrobiota bacterium]